MKHGNSTSNRKGIKKSGFRARMKTSNGRNVLQARRKKGRENICGIYA